MVKKCVGGQCRGPVISIRTFYNPCGIISVKCSIIFRSARIDNSEATPVIFTRLSGNFRAHREVRFAAGDSSEEIAVRTKGTLANTILQGKVGGGEVTRNANMIE